MTYFELQLSFFAFVVVIDIMLIFFSSNMSLISINGITNLFDSNQMKIKNNFNHSLNTTFLELFVRYQNHPPNNYHHKLNQADSYLRNSSSDIVSSKF